MTQRIHKYRAWDEENGMFPVTDLHWDQDGNIYTNGHVLMQFTGLLDSKGKEIFEGDIVDNWGEDGQSEVMAVVFNNETGQWQWGDGTGNSLPLYELDPEETLVIGDIYTTPELLK